MASHELAKGLSGCDILLEIDEGPRSSLVRKEYDGSTSFEGYGVARVANKTP